MAKRQTGARGRADDANELLCSCDLSDALNERATLSPTLQLAPTWIELSSQQHLLGKLHECGTKSVRERRPLPLSSNESALNKSTDHVVRIGSSFVVVQRDEQ